MWRPKGWKNPHLSHAVEIIKATAGYANPKFIDESKRAGTIYEDGADAILKALQDEIQKHPVFEHNCRYQKQKPAKICVDCPFRASGIIL